MCTVHELQWGMQVSLPDVVPLLCCETVERREHRVACPPGAFLQLGRGLCSGLSHSFLYRGVPRMWLDDQGISAKGQKERCRSFKV